jgi:hypothetical protein
MDRVPSWGEAGATPEARHHLLRDGWKLHPPMIHSPSSRRTQRVSRRRVRSRCRLGDERGGLPSGSPPGSMACSSSHPSLDATGTVKPDPSLIRERARCGQLGHRGLLQHGTLTGTEPCHDRKQGLRGPSPSLVWWLVRPLNGTYHIAQRDRFGITAKAVAPVRPSDAVDQARGFQTEHDMRKEIPRDAVIAADDLDPERRPMKLPSQGDDGKTGILDLRGKSHAYLDPIAGDRIPRRLTNGEERLDRDVAARHSQIGSPADQPSRVPVCSSMGPAIRSLGHAADRNGPGSLDPGSRAVRVVGR